MIHTLTDAPATQAFLTRLERAVARRDPSRICDGVRDALAACAQDLDLPAPFHEPRTDGYGRRLVHRCPGGTYSVMAMAWGPGQGTPIHDHAGRWCVECVLEGTIEVTDFDPIGDPHGSTVDFAPKRTVQATTGDIGVLVPPQEYHRIRNPTDHNAVTLHVYAGELLWCHTFHELESGSYRRERCTLGYAS